MDAPRPQGRPPQVKDPVVESRRLRAEARRLHQKSRQVVDHLVWLVDSIKRQWDPAYYHSLERAILTMHRCRSQHTASFVVRKVLADRTVWEGTVEQFRLFGHRHARACYAWHYQEGGQTRSFTLLKLAAVDSPQRAVQLSLAATRRLRVRSAAPFVPPLPGG